MICWCCFPAWALAWLPSPGLLASGRSGSRQDDSSQGRGKHAAAGTDLCSLPTPAGGRPISVFFSWGGRVCRGSHSWSLTGNRCGWGGWHRVLRDCGMVRAGAGWEKSTTTLRWGQREELCPVLSSPKALKDNGGVLSQSLLPACDILREKHKGPGE